MNERCGGAFFNKQIGTQLAQAVAGLFAEQLDNAFDSEYLLEQYPADGDNKMLLIEMKCQN